MNTIELDLEEDLVPIRKVRRLSAQRIEIRTFRIGS
jgi:hypothetical protein